MNVSCYEKVADRDSDDVKKRVADASVTFQANHDSDRREEIRLLYPRTAIGATEAEVREFLGDPSPGISDGEKWVYELGGNDTVTLYFDDGLLETKHWLSMPEELAGAALSLSSKPATDSNQSEEPQQTETSEETTGPSVSTGANRP